MPANLSPEYKAAEANFRKARDPKERLDWLREMLRVIPKHKGTDHLQGDIKRRIRELSEELEVSRGTVRSALAQLANEGLVQQVAFTPSPCTLRRGRRARLRARRGRGRSSSPRCRGPRRIN